MKSQARSRPSPTSFIKAIPEGGGIEHVFVCQLFTEAVEFYFPKSEDANGMSAPDGARAPSQVLGKVGSLQAC